jgi:hypothetical protein
MLDLTDKTEAELLALGLRHWDESGLLLIPGKLYDQIPDGTKLTCISGQTVIKGKDSIDDDTRGGLIAYGVFATDKLTSIVKKVNTDADAPINGANTTRARVNYVTLTDLKSKRGWTQTLVMKFAPEPDLTRTNPHYHSGPRMRLYRLRRIEEIEASAAFVAAQSANARRRTGAKQGIQTKLAKLEAYLKTLRVSVPRLAEERLIRRACESYNSWNADRIDTLVATPQSEPEFLNRLVVNFLRHELSTYDEELERIAGKVGAANGYFELNHLIYAAIKGAYPSLVEECDRQLSWKFGLADQGPR